MRVSMNELVEQTIVSVAAISPSVAPFHYSCHIIHS